MKTFTNSIHKIGLLIIVTLFSSISVLAQNPLSLSHNGEQLNDTIIVVGLTTDQELIAYATVKNNTDHSMDIQVRRTHLQIIEGTRSYFCWGVNCYPPSIDESTNSYTLNSGESTGEEDFSGHYQSNANYGDSFIEYEFFNENNVSENVKLVVQFVASVVGTEELKQNQFSVYPNPASSKVTIQSELSINKIEIYNQSGQLIKYESVNENVLMLNVSEFNQGIYYLKVYSEGNVTTKKLLIR